MSEDKVYKDGDIVWVKLGNNWWPGEVTGPTRHPEGLIKHLKRLPYCVVKFFNETTYEYVRSSKQIFPFECPKQEDFIRKGYSLYNSGNSFMEKFPTDVEVAKQLTRRKETSLIINDRPDSIVKAILGQPLIRTYDEYYDGSECREKRRSGDSVTKILNITQNRNNDELSCEKPKTQTLISNFSQPNDKTKIVTNIAAADISNYQCNFCEFSSVRLNVMILHRKMHSNRNSLGSNDATLSSKPITPSSTPAGVVAAPAITTNAITGRNKKIQQKSPNCNKDKNNSKTKGRTSKTSGSAQIGTDSPLNKTNTTTTAPVGQANTPAVVTDTELVPLKQREINNTTTKLQAPVNKSKAAKKTLIVKEKKEESVYEAILSDFSSIERDTSPPPEEKQSRRSLRHCKNTIENAAKPSTIFIDLSETKTIKKIPKKREYAQSEIVTKIMAPALMPGPDVVCLVPEENENTTNTPKNDAEDIRRMLLADWSDDDEAPTDAIVVDDCTVVEHAESVISISANAVSELHISSAVAITTKPVIQTSLPSTGRIRNIPKKDRRDAVLQDFNSDLLLVQNDNLDNTPKPVAFDIDSSNSSGVEIIEDPLPADIITINDDEDQEKSKSQKNQITVAVTETKDSDKSASTATSTSTLSCFDFQDDEDEQENSTTTIPHFKKKYLSGDKLQSLSSTTTDDALRDDNMAKNRAELAEKDQRLAAEIASLLEQSQPTVADLLNTNSFEESMSVKDLPIKERGKRIFKSRNKIRMEDAKTNIELATATTVDFDMPIEAQTLVTKSSVNITTATDNLGNDKEPEMIIIDRNITNTKCLIEIFSQETSFSTQTEIPKFLEANQLASNENEENNDIPDELSPIDNNTPESQNELMENAKVSTDENIDNEKAIENIEKGEPKDENNAFNQSRSDQENIVEEQTGAADTDVEKGGPFETKQAQVEADVWESPDTQSVITENINVRANSEAVLDTEANKNSDSFPIAPELEVVDTEDVTPTNKIKILKVQVLDHVESNVTIDLANETAKETNVKKSSEEFSRQIVIPEEKTSDKSVKTLNSDKDDNTCKNESAKQFAETSFNIRVKSPEQLLNQALVMNLQQEHELPTTIDNNADIRVITRTPTDENSSMGASDTGAEFGSPTSMLSEERLPAFRFHSNQTPQQEIETTEAELKLENIPESHQEQTNQAVVASTVHMREELLKFKSQIYEDCVQKSVLPRRRLSMDFNSQTEPKVFKRIRLSVDDITIIEDSTCKQYQENLSLSLIKSNIRPKSRHMKFTPRRNVTELFKEHSSLGYNLGKDGRNKYKITAVTKTHSTDDQVVTKEKEQLKNIVSINENSNRLSDDELVEKTVADQQIEQNNTATFDNAVGGNTSKNGELESQTDMEELIIKPDENQENVVNEQQVTGTIVAENVEAPSLEEAKTIKVDAVAINLQESLNNSENNHENELKSQSFDDILTDGSNKSVAIEDKSAPKSTNVETTDESILRNLNRIENSDSDSPESAPTIVENRVDKLENKTLSFDNCKMVTNQLIETPFSPGVRPPTPQEGEVVIESENLNQSVNILQENQTKTEEKCDLDIFFLTPNEQETSKETTNKPLSPKETEHSKIETDNQSVIPKEDEPFREKVVCTLTSSADDETVSDANNPSATPTNGKIISVCETLTEPSIPHEPLHMIIEFENNVTTPSTIKESSCNDEYENGMEIASTLQAKDLIIECEPKTPQDIIECDHNISAQVTPEKEIIVESNVITSASIQAKDFIIEDNLQLEEKDNLLEREFQAVHAKENFASVDMPQESGPHNLQTDADKAAEEFLIEFDSIVNHSHTVEDDMQSTTVQDDINAEDLINNIIEEVQEDHQLKQDEASKSDPPLSHETLTTYKVVAHKNSWNQIFKDSFNRQLPANKRRKTICFEISDIKEGVACKKQAFDFESMLPVNKTIKRTAERKLTLPAIETKLSNNSQPHNIFALKNHTQLSMNKKIIPNAKRKLSIEDNITSFIIERPKQPEAANASSGPPPLQRIRPLSTQAIVVPKTGSGNLSEPPPPLGRQSSEIVYQEFFPSESTSSTKSRDISQKNDGGIVIHQQIIRSPTISSTHQSKNTDAKLSMNKQIGIDSRGNKYVIIKTPPTDIVVQPTLTSSTSAAVAATTNFGTTITIQPLGRTTTDVSTTNTITKNINLSPSFTTSSHKQQLQKISITVPSKSPLEISSSSEMSAKAQSRNKRKTAQAKVVAAAAPAANSNINSAKHRQAIEALSRRLSIGSEVPSLAKMSRKPSTHVQTQINSNNLTTCFGDTQISSIAQQQLIHLQQQQQQQHAQTSTPLPTPIILNKNAHNQSAIQRKARKIPQQQHQHKQVQHKQLIATTKSTQLQQPQQSQVQHQHNQQQKQQKQQQFITQISQQQSQQQTSLQPPPLQQIQPQTVAVQQQIVQQNDGIIITTATATDDDNVIDSNTQLIALPTQPYPGYSETFLLCKVKGNTCKPVDNVPLYLNHQLNELVPVPLEAIESGQKQLEHQTEINASSTHEQQLKERQKNDRQDNEDNLQVANINCNLVENEISAGTESEHQIQHQQQIMEDCVTDENGVSANNNQINDFAANQEVNTELVPNNGILLNIEGQQVLLDAATFAHLLANPDANTQLISDDGTEYVLTHEVLAALQMQQEQQQALELVNAATEQQQQHQQLDEAGSTDIIAVALAGSDLYDSDVLTIDTSQGVQLISGDGSIVFPTQSVALTQQHLTPPAVVTNAVLDQSPIMSTLEVPSSIAMSHKLQGTQLITVPSHHLVTSANAALGIGARPNLEDSLAAIGVTTQTSNIPSSLGLPITVTNPNIASKVTSVGPLNDILQFVSHRPATAAATAAAVAAAAIAGESRIFTD